MTLKRLIPIILVKEGLLVRSQLFKYFQAIGDPIPTIKRLSDWNADEIILNNISDTDIMDSRREDKYHNIGKGSFIELVEKAAKFCHCPLTIGGGIRSSSQIDELFQAGADKVVINSSLFDNPDLIRKSSLRYGKQAITGSIDIRHDSTGSSVWKAKGKINTGFTLDRAIEYATELGVGELIISSINNDGSTLGYDKHIIEVIEKMVINIPIIINSGATTNSHFMHGLNSKNVSAVAASNVFYFTELSYFNIKKELVESGCKNVRYPSIDSPFIKREPEYSQTEKNLLMEKARENSTFHKDKYDGSKLTKIRQCTSCLYTSISAAPMQFAEDGECMGCKISKVKLSQTNKRYDQLKEYLSKIINSKNLSKSYDCIVSVSGGKDSYYQTHYIKEVMGLNPLLVTYNGNNYTDIGWKNLWNMRNAFDCDHLVISPSVKTLKKLNKIAFIVMGDMNWHSHVGIYTTAPRIAVQQKIPLIFWGEHGYADLCGQFSMSDFPEMNYRERTEHDGRGFDWNFFVGIDGITDKDMTPWKYPSDKDISNIGLRQIFLGHYIPWESNTHLELVVEKYGFEVSDTPFERTYRKGSNLDDMHENGIHDYLKFIKFGYGRCTDHASKDIRAGILSRTEGIKLVEKMDHIKPKDLARWLNYVGMSERDFDRIADHFRDPRVWSWKEDTGWSKSY
ncbi:N-acetyl sugar amidotransferase [Synechococcus sp. CC9616]|uniref:N-acetyl sugar amidotransferase n=1 Tax=Synechococcus sp. CC9616 TaxID=110663 RepID=UPI0004AEFA89|nr:N-acetyl sugar amidotransferase [Synechococcus sp. CC9616]